MNSNDATDEQLVQQIRDGDVFAFELLIRRHQDRIFRLASVWLYDDQQAADVVQEVFLRSHKGLRSFRFRSSVFTWLYRTTRNVCHEHNRKRSVQPLDTEPVDMSANPAQSAANAETAQKVRKLVAVLPQRQREVVMLRIFEGLSVREAALAMGCREGTVKALLHKASAKLRIDFNEQGLTS
ncbi:MAG: RNA polymerase sigma factor [Pseudomonadales bacterium]